MTERRQSARIFSGVRIRYARYDGVHPTEEAFEVGTTRNLSTAGISFFCEAALEPDTKVVLRLGSDIEPITVLADVLHCQADHLAEAEPYFVGCKFIGRL